MLAYILYTNLHLANRDIVQRVLTAIAGGCSHSKIGERDRCEVQRNLFLPICFINSTIDSCLALRLNGVRQENASHQHEQENQNRVTIIFLLYHIINH